MAGEAADPKAARLRLRLERERKARREAEAIAENATRRLYAADELKSEFIANVTHELRTPLAAMKGSLGALSHDWDLLDDEDRIEVFGVLLRNAEALGKLVDQLLDFSRAALSAGAPAGVTVNPRVECLSDLVTTVVGDVGPALGDHAVVVDIAPDVYIHADAAAVRQVLANLLENAAKYSPPATTISVDVRADGASAVLGIEDEGAGIPARERERVFERFYRAEGALALGTRGLGIGLSLVRALVEAMDGTVTVDEGRGPGARFVVRLPLVGPAVG